MRRSGITSRSKCASFSRNHTSCSNIGPRGPAVREFWFSATGAPATVVNLGLSVMFSSLDGIHHYSETGVTGGMGAIIGSRTKRDQCVESTQTIENMDIKKPSLKARDRKSVV